MDQHHATLLFPASLVRLNTMLDIVEEPYRFVKDLHKNDQNGSTVVRQLMLQQC